MGILAYKLSDIRRLKAINEFIIDKFYFFDKFYILNEKKNA